MSDKLNGRRKAAVLLISLGPELSANVLKHLRETEIEQLTYEVFSTESVNEEVRVDVLTDFYELALANGYLSTGGTSYAQEMLSRALGPEKAAEIMSRLVASMKPHYFDFLRDTDPARLAQFIQEEQPQAIALILAHLPATVASKVLSNLLPDVRAEVAMRIATMERTPPEVVEGVESILRRRLATIIDADFSSAGGVEHLVQVLTNCDRGTERVILEYLDKNNPTLAEEVRKLTFVFDNLAQLDDASLQRVLREVDAKDLGLALRSIGEELRERIFRNLSTRAAEMLREDIAVSGPVRLRHVEEAQTRILAIVRRLEEAGDLVIQRGADDVLV